MGYDSGEYGYPLKPWQVGRSAIGAMHDYLSCQEDHQRWHREHPGEMCDPESFPVDIDSLFRGEKMLRFAGGGTVEPGDAFAPQKEGGYGKK
jgi:hypothetical protein